jgi:hypothetical protein
VAEGKATNYVAVKHGVEAGQKIVVQGASLLSQRL